MKDIKRPIYWYNSLRDQNDNLFKAYNKISNLNFKEFEYILDSANIYGNVGKLQSLYKQLEMNCPMLFTCKQKRQAKLNKNWAINYNTLADEDRNLANQQYEYIKNIISNLESKGSLHTLFYAIQNSAFSGLFAALPMFDENDNLELIVLPNTNLILDKHITNNIDIYWTDKESDIGLDFNHNRSKYLSMLPNITNDIIFNYNENALDNYILPLYLSYNIGLDSLRTLVGRKGLGQVFLVMPDGVGNDETKDWAAYADIINKGANAALPSESKIIFQNIDFNSAKCIEDFLDNIDKQIVLLCTGGTVNSIGGSTGLGSNIAEIHEKAFDEICLSDNASIANVINNQLIKILLTHKFGTDTKQYIYFDFISNKENIISNKDIFNNIKTIIELGYKIDNERLADLTDGLIIYDKDEHVDIHNEDNKDPNTQDKKILNNKIKFIYNKIFR